VHYWISIYSLVIWLEIKILSYRVSQTLKTGNHKNGVWGGEGGFAAFTTPTSPLFMPLVGKNLALQPALTMLAFFPKNPIIHFIWNRCSHDYIAMIEQ
jgi:hypothetical protein